MRSDLAKTDVVIVGSGFSGTTMAAQLSARGLSVTLVEGGARAGQGTAYSTSDAVHLLNVPAARMSAWPDRPDDFVAAGHAAGAFATRREYGEYLSAILKRAVADGVELIEASAVSAERPSDWLVTLDSGRKLAARALVLAQGNQPSEAMDGRDAIDAALFVDDPWSLEARVAIERVARDDGAVLVLGTGLTMVDVVLSLDAAGHRGPIVALSRRGQVPRSHAPHDAAPVGFDDVPQGNVLALWRWLRRRSEKVEWRAAVDALRPHAQALWQGLGIDEQRRFLRHARPYWDVHRHRIAPQVAERLAALIGAGRLEVVAGRLVGASEDEGMVQVKIVRRGRPRTPPSFAESPSLARGERFGAVFNCTGPLGAIKRTRDPLLRQMIDDGVVAVDRLGIGLAVNGESLAGERMWALGPLTKGVLWEIVAVPDIRGQVARVADHIARELEA